MLTRRDMMLSLSAMAFQNRARGQAAELQIESERHSLSEESAEGYRIVMNEEPRTARGSTLLIAPGARQLTIERCRRLVSLVERGAWLLLESGVCFSCCSDAAMQASLVEKVFGIMPLAPIVTGRDPAEGFYAEFCWPLSRLVRAFHAVVPIAPGDHQVIARLQEREICVRKPIARGGIIYLGTMLGPGLLARDREALELCRELAVSG